MILVWLTFIPLVAGLAAWITGGRRPMLSRWLALSGLAVDLALVVCLWAEHFGHSGARDQAGWLVEFRRQWIAQLGVSFSLAVDGLSLLLVTLTLFLGLACVVCSWTEVTERVGFFHFNLMASLAGIIGVFLAVDLVLFYFFWELMLVPMYFLIALWGHANRLYAAIKFFIFTQGGGLLMLAGIIGLYWVHGQQTGLYTFHYEELLGTRESWTTTVLMLGFFAAFAVKLPMVPLHPWLPDAHTEAPTAGSVILAGLLLKTGGYGMIRFILPLFPEASATFAFTAMIMGVIGIIYGAVCAFAQEDLKRLVAYTSISHLGFVLVGVFCGTEAAIKGSVMQMICHGISTGALFILVGMIQERIRTRQLTAMGGFWSSAPRMGGVAMVFALASLGLPGMGNFVAEFLVLVGTFQAHPWVASASALGLVLAAIYSLWLMRTVFFGPSEIRVIPDLSGRETALMAALAAVIVLLGLFPQPVLNAATTARKLSGAVFIKDTHVSRDRPPIFDDQYPSPRMQASHRPKKESSR